jgi:hypothetical protein
MRRITDYSRALVQIRSSRGTGRLSHCCIFNPPNAQDYGRNFESEI